MSIAARADAARQIARWLKQTHWLHPGARVGCYLAMPDEVDTAGCIAAALARGCRLFLPRITDVRRRQMTFTPFAGPMRRNVHGIPEPDARDRLAARWLDVILVPTVGFDACGHRLGMGAGYYDRALAFRLRHPRWRGPRLVGLAFDCQQLQAIEPGPHDVPLDAIITENGLRRFT
jgi:5-formyltetrahydrofolate cyclo-ligase